MPQGKYFRVPQTSASNTPDTPTPPTHPTTNKPHQSKPQIPPSAIDSDNSSSDESTAKLKPKLSPTKKSPTSPTFPTLTRFIKLIGAPPPSLASNNITTPTSATSIASPVSPSEEPIVDVLEASNEDPFTLECFERLIALHAENGKDFLLARVRTVDPMDEERFYYSYYAAHHINKVLFRTQPEEGLLHRMKAKNPLNNMTIVGDVHYYVVSANSVNLQNALLNANTSRSSIDSTRSTSSIKSIISVLSTGHTATSSLLGPNTHHTARESELFRRHERTKSGGSVTSPVGGSADGTHPDGTGIAANLSWFMNMAGSSLRHAGGAGRKRTLHLIMKPGVLEGVEEVVPLSVEEGGKGTGEDGERVKRMRRPTSAGNAPRIELVGPDGGNTTSRRNSADDAYAEVDGPYVGGPSKPPMIRASLDETRSYNSPRNIFPPSTQPGEGTLYPPEAGTPRLHRRVRSIAFSNEHRGTMNLHEWIRMHSLQSDQQSDPSHHEEDISPTKNKASNRPPTLSNPTPRRPPTTITTSTANQPHHARRPTTELESQPDSPFLPTAPPYTARFYATDDDFLMKASVRAYFKEHALEIDDGVLFSITGGSLGGGGEALQHPALEGFAYAVEEGAGWMGMKAVKWALVGYVAFGFMLVEFLVPETYAYIVAFLLIFFLCIVLILCV